MAMLPMLPESNAATRAHCTRMVAPLEDMGIRAHVFSPSSPRAYSWTLHGRLRPVRLLMYWYGVVLPRRLVQLVRGLMAHDVVFVQRGLLRYTSLPLLECLLYVGSRVLRTRVLYHLDDALYVIKPRMYSLRCRMADLVLTGNPDIAAFARRFNSNVELIDGSVPVDRYPVKMHQAGPVTIGWVGSLPQNLDPVLPVLHELAGRPGVRVVAYTAQPPSGGETMWRRWTSELEYSLFEQFDIGIMPLEDEEYERAKEAYKLKEYMAAGLPVVCSPVGHNKVVCQEGVTGYFATGPEEWRDRLERLIRDPRLRQRMGQHGRNFVAERYDVRRHAQRLAEIVCPRAS